MTISGSSSRTSRPISGVPLALACALGCLLEVQLGESRISKMKTEAIMCKAVATRQWSHAGIQPNFSLQLQGNLCDGQQSSWCSNQGAKNHLQESHQVLSYGLETC